MTFTLRGRIAARPPAISFGRSTGGGGTTTSSPPKILAVETAVGLAATQISGATNTIELTGYTATGDGGGGRYRRAASEPTHDGKLQSADGTWWELAETVVSPRMFGALADGVSDDTAACQAALNFSNEVDLGTDGDVYALSSRLSLQPGQIFRANGATLRMDADTDAILRAADDCHIVGIIFNCNNDDTTFPLPGSKADWGIDLAQTQRCVIENCTFMLYRRGINCRSTGLGIICGEHRFLNNRFQGSLYSGLESSNLQIGIYIGADGGTHPPVNTDINSFSEAEYASAEWTREIIVNGNTFVDGQYGIAVHRGSKVTITGNTFSLMSRGISIQHQSCDVAVTGNQFSNLDSTGCHMASGARNISVTGNTFHGTLQNDNVHVQAYYGCSDITISGNAFDSRFAFWDGGTGNETRRPGWGIRIGQQTENMTISANVFRGFFAAIYLNSTIYPLVITPSDPNYQNAGFRNIKIVGNIITGDYYQATTVPPKFQMTNTQTYGIWVNISGAWEDKDQGAWDIEDVQIAHNSVQNVSFSYVLQQAAMTAVNPTQFLDNGLQLTNNTSRNATNSDIVITSEVNAQAAIQSGNSWNM